MLSRNSEHQNSDCQNNALLPIQAEVYDVRSLSFLPAICPRWGTPSCEVFYEVDIALVFTDRQLRSDDFEHAKCGRVAMLALNQHHCVSKNPEFNIRKRSIWRSRNRNVRSPSWTATPVAAVIPILRHDFESGPNIRQHTFCVITDLFYDGMVQYGLTSHPTHYRSFRGRFTGRMTQPTVSQHWRTMVSQPRQGPIAPGSAHSKVNQKM